MAASWFICPRPNASARWRLFCLPYAGAGASIYRAWSREIPATVEMRAIQIPGRESRLAEAPARDAIELSAQVAAALEPHLDRPFALFGYSMGALLAFEVMRALRRRGLRLPGQLFVAAMRAPQVASIVPRLADLPEPELLRGLRAHYQPPEDALDIPELRAMLLPILRADIALVDDYVYHQEPPFGCGIDAFVGSHDASTPVSAAGGWREQTRGPFTLEVFAAGHFFLERRPSPLLARISARLDALAGAAG